MAKGGQMAKGLYTNSELVDSIILDLNNLPKELIDGQFIQGCSLIAQMSQKLINLRQTIDSDLKSRDKTIESLKAEIRNLGGEVIDVKSEVLENGSN